MEFIDLTLFITPEEKMEIPKGYLIPQELKRHALKRGEFRISDGALKLLIDEYTREAGVRDLRKKGLHPLNGRKRVAHQTSGL